MCCTTFSFLSPGILEQHVYKKMDRMQWTNSNGAHSSALYCLDFYVLGHLKSTVMLQKTMTSRTCTNEYRINLRWCLWHLQFSSESRNDYSYVQHRRWALWASSSIVMSLLLGNHASEGLPPHPNSGIDSSSVCLAMYFSFTLYSNRSEITNKLCPFST